MAIFNFGNSFRRTTPAPLDISLVVPMLGGYASLEAVRLWPNSYAGMLVSDTAQPGKIFQLNVGKATWSEISNPFNKYIAYIGNGIDLQYTIQHNLNSEDVLIQVRRSTDPKVIEDVCGKKIMDVNNVQITFSGIAALNEYRIIIFG